MVARHSRRAARKALRHLLSSDRRSVSVAAAVANNESNDAFASHHVRAKIAEPAVYWTVASQTSPFDPAFTTAS